MSVEFRFTDAKHIEPLCSLTSNQSCLFFGAKMERERGWKGRGGFKHDVQRLLFIYFKCVCP